MQNLIVRVDQEFLRYATKIANAWAWATGLDNFWIGRQLSIFAGISGIPTYLTWSPEIRMMALLLPMGAACSYFDVKNDEERTERNCLYGAKDIEEEMQVFSNRIFFLMFFCFLLGLYLGNSISQKKINDWLVLGFSCICARFYFTSIEHPPYNRSQAWQWLKGKLGLEVPQSSEMPSPTC